MWKVYKAGHYIQETFISKHKSENKAIEAAKKKIDFVHMARVETKKEIIIWLENKDKIPIGIIVKIKGA
tara:strand:+ start:338 stop:544 length:207 start_codon:yes stop_codon:yes gene_type:complete